MLSSFWFYAVTICLCIVKSQQFEDPIQALDFCSSVTWRLLSPIISHRVEHGRDKLTHMSSSSFSYVFHVFRSLDVFSSRLVFNIHSLKCCPNCTFLTFFLKWKEICGFRADWSIFSCIFFNSWRAAPDEYVSSPWKYQKIKSLENISNHWSLNYLSVIL